MKQHRFNYAYCIIRYESLSGDRVEWLWNSRDGYVPMRVRDANTGEWLNLSEVERYAPDYVPEVGERILVDLTPTRARMAAVEQLDQILADPQRRETMESVYPTRDEAITAIAERLMHPIAIEGALAADLLVVTSGYIDELLEARKRGAEPEVGLKPLLEPVEPSELGEDVPSSLLFYDRQGMPISARRYLELSGDWNYKKVAHTEIGEDFVSTSWLGHDHGWAWPPGSRPPVIFETMVFRKLAKPETLLSGTVLYHRGHEQERYRTEAEALAGHERIVARMRAGLPVYEDDSEDAELEL